MEEKSREENIKEEIKDVINIVELLEISLEDNEEDGHIIRSIHIIEKMLKSIIDN